MIVAFEILTGDDNTLTITGWGFLIILLVAGLLGSDRT